MPGREIFIQSLDSVKSNSHHFTTITYAVMVK